MKVRATIELRSHKQIALMKTHKIKRLSIKRSLIKIRKLRPRNYLGLKTQYYMGLAVGIQEKLTSALFNF